MRTALAFLTLAALTPIGLGQSTLAAPQQSQATAAISGVVVDAGTQKPVGGAVVLLQSVALIVPPALGRRQFTDELGRFVFTDLPGQASYSVSATKPGYFDGAYGRRGQTSASNARRITLTNGQWFRDARVELVRLASISGTVTAETGDPLVGVTVRTYNEIFVGGVRQLASAQSAATDDRGMYRIANVQPGRYFVSVPSVQNAAPADLATVDLPVPNLGSQDALSRDMSLNRGPSMFALHPGHRLILSPGGPPLPPSAAGRTQVYPMTFYPAARTIADATTIEIQGGVDRSSVDLQLRPAPGFRISGRLDGPADAISGMSLRLMTAGLEALGRGSEQATALVAKDGTFTFLNVPNGAYTILADRGVTEYTSSGGLGFGITPGMRFTSMMTTSVYAAPAGTMLMRAVQQGNQRYQGRQAVTVGGHDISDAIVPMVAGVNITGRIVLEVANPDAPNWNNISVTAEPANGDLSLGLPRSVRDQDDPAWYFGIEGVRPGAYLMRVQSPAGTVKSVTFNGRDYTDTPMDTSGGRDIIGVVITITDQVTTLSGTVRDRNGQPAPNTAIIAFPADRALWTNFGTQPGRIRSSTGSTSGAYTLRGLPAGDYLVVGVDDESADRWKDPAFLEAAARVAVRVSIDWNETKTLDVTLQDIK